MIPSITCITSYIVVLYLIFIHLITLCYVLRENPPTSSLRKLLKILPSNIGKISVTSYIRLVVS